LLVGIDEEPTLPDLVVVPVDDVPDQLVENILRFLHSANSEVHGRVEKNSFLGSKYIFKKK
jgi:hypothetical protein